MTISIQASVGLHGDNKPDDVIVVKSRLLELGFPFVTADSVMGPLTIKSIRLFQAVKNGLNDVDDQRNDGRRILYWQYLQIMYDVQHPGYWHKMVGMLYYDTHGQQLSCNVLLKYNVREC